MKKLLIITMITITIVVNKWDEYEKETGTLERYKKEIYEKLSYLSYAPILFISAKTGQRVEKLFELINHVAEQNALRVSTSVLNQVINEAIAVVQPPTDKGKRLKILYGTQVATKPPTFVIFVNDKELFHFSYERYLVVLYLLVFHIIFLISFLYLLVVEPQQSLHLLPDLMFL